MYFTMEEEKKSILFSDVNPDIKSNDSENSKVISELKELEVGFLNDHSSLLMDSCFVDYSGRQFACLYNLCHDHSNCFKNDLFQKNLYFHSLNFHPEDRKLWREEILPDIVQFLDSVLFDENKDYRISFNHRYIQSDGHISQFMHEGSLSCAENKCLPILNLKVFFEIGEVKTDDSMVLTIFRYSTELGYEKVFNRVYTNNHNTLLTQRELEIISLCHEGLSSKRIADKLKLSIHTVKNHKRKIMEKTQTHNITELIHTCILNHWL